MSSWKYWLSLGCLLLLGSPVKAASLQEVAWQAAYDSSLCGDAVAMRNALVRLKDYHRFNLVSLTREQEATMNQVLAQLVLPKAETFAPVDVVKAEPLKVDPFEIKRPRKRTRLRPEKNKKPSINKDQLEADLLKKAESAYQFGRLEESQRFFKLALKVKPSSTEAKMGLEKIAAEMK